MRMLQRMVSVFLLWSALFLAGCKKDSAAVEPDVSTAEQDEGAAVIAASLGGAQSTQGLTAQIELLSGNLNLGRPVVRFAKGTQTADTILVFSRVGTYSYAYTFSLSAKLVGATQLNFDYLMRGTYSTPRLSSADSAEASLVVTSLLTGSSYTFNGTYRRRGSELFKASTTLLTTSLAMTLTDVHVDKSSHQIADGTATVAFQAQVNGGTSLAFTATITFLGNQRASLLVGGTTYVINLSTGEILS